MIIVKFNDDRPDQYLSPLSFPLTLIAEDGREYRVELCENGGFNVRKKIKEAIALEKIIL